MTFMRIPKPGLIEAARVANRDVAPNLSAGRKLLWMAMALSNGSQDQASMSHTACDRPSDAGIAPSFALGIRHSDRLYTMVQTRLTPQDSRRLHRNGKTSRGKDEILVLNLGEASRRVLWHNFAIRNLFITLMEEAQINCYQAISYYYDAAIYCDAAISWRAYKA